MGAVSEASHTREANFSTYRNLSANLAGQFIGLALPVLLSPIVIRIVGPSQYGLIGIFNTLLAVTVIFDYGFALVINREIARRSHASPGSGAALRTVQGSLELLLFAIGVGMTAAALLASGWLVTHWLQVPAEDAVEARYCLILGAAALCLPRVKAFSMAVLNANHRQVEQNAIALSANLTRYIVGISALLLISKTALVYLLAQFVISITEAIVFHFRAWRGISSTPEAPLWSGTYVRSVMPDLAANWGANAAAIVLMTADKIIASGAAPIAEYGRYVLVASAVGILGSTVAMSQQVYLPLLVRYYTSDQKRNLRDAYRTFSTISSALVMPAMVGAVVFGDHLLLLLMGNNIGSLQYYWTILALLAAGGSLSAFSRVAHTMQIAVGRPDIALKFNAVSAVIYPLALWIIVQQFGLLGAAATWLIFSTLYLGPFFVVTSRIYPGVSAIQWFWRHIIIPGMISAVTFVLARQLQAAWPLLLWPSFVLAGATAAILTAALDPTIRADAELGLAIINRRAKAIQR
jgi:O-antigen/teichoic acid export membrane protein